MTGPSAEDRMRRAVAISENTIDGVLVQETRAHGLRTAFYRLVPAGTASPADTIQGECHVDVDTEGRIIGVYIVFDGFDGEPR